MRSPWSTQPTDAVALGYLGWFISPWVPFVTTGAVVIVTWRRQFASNAWRAMGLIRMRSPAA